MTQQEIEQCFDFSITDRKAEVMGTEMVSKGWELDKTRWLQTESAQFYKGMYAAIRLIHSASDDEQINNMFTRIGLDCLFIIHKLNEMSKVEGSHTDCA